MALLYRSWYPSVLATSDTNRSGGQGLSSQLSMGRYWSYGKTPKCSALRIDVIILERRLSTPLQSPAAYNAELSDVGAFARRPRRRMPKAHEFVNEVTVSYKDTSQ